MKILFSDIFACHTLIYILLGNIQDDRQNKKIFYCHVLSQHLDSNIQGEAVKT